MSKACIEKTDWPSIRDRMMASNPDLAQIIDDYQPTTEHELYIVRYPYGSDILKSGNFYIPTEAGDSVLLSKVDIDSVIRDQLSYSHIPIGMVLNRSMEVYFESKHRVMPARLYTRGTTFGLWELFDSDDMSFDRNIWWLSAGARSIFLLPKVSDEIAHNRLRRDFGIADYTPKTLLDQHHVFRDLLQKTQSNWCTEILLFGRKWAELDLNHVHSYRLFDYWRQIAWRQAAHCRAQIDYHIVWETFSNELSRRNWKPRPYITNIIKHLIAMNEGVFPGFIPAEGDESAPISEIQKIYTEHYLLKKYPPVLMAPHHYQTGDLPVYYSLGFPSLLEVAPRGRVSSSVMEDIKELKRLADLFIATVGCQIHLDFYHSENCTDGDVQPVANLLKRDRRFKKLFEGYEVPQKSPFFKGCVAVSREPVSSE